MAITNQDIATKLDTLSETVNLRLGRIESNLEKLNAAVYGNGEPGLKEQVRSVGKIVDEFKTGGTPALRDVAERVKHIEETHAACPVIQLEKTIEDIEDRHAREDEAIKDAKEDRRAANNEGRKFRFALVVFVITTLVNIVLAGLNIAH